MLTSDPIQDDTLDEHVAKLVDASRVITVMYTMHMADVDAYVFERRTVCRDLRGDWTGWAWASS